MRVGFVRDTVELDVQGEVDTFSAPELSAVLHAMIEHGHRAVVLGLSEVSFMDAAGLGVIASGARRLRTRDGTLTLRAPSVMVRRLLAVTGLTPVVQLERTPLPSRLGPEARTDPEAVPVNTGTYAATQRLQRMASIPADGDVVDGALRLVVNLAQATVAGADGVSVSLQRHGQLSTVASSDETIAAMDAEQYATGEGPCVDASVAGHWFHTESLDEETRWPSFIPRAQALGINAILSTPLIAASGPVGALNMYSRTTSVFTPEEQQLASMFAQEASRILTDARVDVTDDEMADRLHAALRSREIIAQAQGVIMERDAVSEDDAYTALRTFSMLTNVPLKVRAARVVESTRQSLSQPPPQGRQVDDD